jgi:oligoendopeptidase F
MYQKLVDHTEFDSIQVDTGERLDARLDYGRLIRDQSRDIREKAFHNYFGSYGQHRDLYAYVLLKELKTYDTMAQIRHYSGRQEERFFDLYLEPNHVRNVYSQIEARGDLVKRYQDLRMARVSQLMGIEDVNAWDMSVIPEDFQRPRYDIMEATGIIREALGILGDEYGELLAALLDPDQGRIDIVAGPKRVPGAFSYGYYGHPRLFFSQKYEGYVSDLSTLAHESGHAVHYQIMEEAGARLLYAHGPTYVTESVAMLNELLLKDYLWEMNKEADIDTRVFFLEKLVGETTAFFWTAEIATLESALYDSADAGLLHTADDLDSLTLSISRRFSAFTNKHPNEYRRFWSMVEHYYEQPMYNVNYVLAAVLALRFYQEMKQDPVFVNSYLRLLEHPFDRPAPEILRLIVGANLRDPELLESAFDFVSDKLDELETLYREAGVKIE